MKKPLSRLVVLGGNQMAAPAILRMRERGHQVIVIDGSPTAPARLVADQFIHQNFAEVAATSEAPADSGVDAIESPAGNTPPIETADE